MPTKKESTGIRIFLKVKETLDVCLAEKGLTQVEFTSRLITWYSKQDKTLQNVMLGNEEPDHEIEILKLIENKLLAKEKANVDAPTAEVASEAKKDADDVSAIIESVVQAEPVAEKRRKRKHNEPKSA